MKVKINSLFIYPLKSAAGIELKSMRLNHVGPDWDRHWMVVTDNGLFITQRTHPQLALIKTAITDHFLELSAPQKNKIKIPLNLALTSSINVSIFAQPAKGFDCGAEANAWISDFLGTNSKIVYYSPQAPRHVSPKYSSGEQLVSFADGFPLLLTSTSTLDHLNSKMVSAVGMERFRPNIIVEGAEADSEDSWTHFKIGTIKFTNAKPCSRCKIITVDQQQGKAVDPSPLKTLQSYRSKDNKIYFGINLIHSGPGIINVGDDLEF